MRIGGNRRGAVGQQRPCKFGRNRHTTFDVNVGVDKTRRYEPVLEVVAAVCLTGPKTGNHAIGDGNVGCHDFTGINIDHPCVGKQQVGR